MHEVVIIGGGIAGIAAQLTLSKLGVTSIILEAKPRLGGRVHTDFAHFGSPYDVGAFKIHNGPENPLIEVAKQNGFELTPTNDDEILYINGKKAEQEEVASFDRAWIEADKNISISANHKKDSSVLSAIEENTNWRNLLIANYGVWEVGEEPSKLSCKDWSKCSAGEEYYSAQGYGSIISHLAKSTNSITSTPINQVTYDNKTIAVTCEHGKKITCSRILITVSVGVLAQEMIFFSPSLPTYKIESFKNIGMGVYNNLAIQFSKDPFGLGESVSVANDKNSNPFGAVLNLCGNNITYVYLGGPLATELEMHGKESATEYGVEKLKELFGSNILKFIRKSATTSWGSDPHTFGSVSFQSIGHTSARADYSKNIDSRIFFAGEASDTNLWGTCGGAYLSGVSEARKIYESLLNN